MSHTLEPTEPRQISISDYEVNPCGCKVSFGHDPHPAVPWMHYCKLHAAAPAMREALKELLTEDGHYLECEDRTHQETSWVTIKQCQQIQQVLAQVEGRT